MWRVSVSIYFFARSPEGHERTIPDSRGWREIDHTFERIEEALAYVLSMGGSVVVMAPEELKNRVLKSTKIIIKNYTQ